MQELDVSALQKLAALGSPLNELFDFSLPEMRFLYDSVVAAQKARVTERDTESFGKVQSHVQNHFPPSSAVARGEGVVLLSGAYVHMIGAVLGLQKDYNVHYVPVGDARISNETSEGKYSGKVGASGIRKQMERAIGVVNYLGFKTMEDLRAAIDAQPVSLQKPTLTILAFHETGYHALPQYSARLGKASLLIEEILLSAREKPAGFLYIGEDLFSSHLRNDVISDCPSDYPRTFLLQKLHQSGISVHVEAFGDDEQTLSKSSTYGLQEYSPPTGSVFDFKKY